MLMQIAFKSIIMHWKRSLVVVVAAAFSVMILATASSVINGVVEGFFSDAIETSGHLRIRHGDLDQALDPLSPRYLIPEDPGLPGLAAASAAKHRCTVNAIEPILSLGSLLVEETRNMPLMIHGLSPDSSYFLNAREGITRGGFLPAADSLYLSESSAAMLGKDLGESIMVLVKDVDGNPWYQEFRIDGLFATASATWDEGNAFMQRGTAQEMLGAPGMVSEYRISLSDRDRAAAVMADLMPVLSGGVDIQDWSDIHASTLSLLKLVQIGVTFISLLFAVVAASIITNTVLMSIFERVREFGTLRAIGMKRSQQRSLILMEAAMLGLCGSIAGLSAAVVILGVMTSLGGLDFGAIMEGLGLGRFAKPSMSAGTVVFCLVLGMVVSLVSSLYAARVLGKMSVADSLSHT